MKKEMQSYNNLEKINTSEKIPLSAIVIFFFLIYGFSIAGIDMRYPFLIVAFIFMAFRFRSFSFPKSVINMVCFLVIMAIYSISMALINGTGDYFEFMRFMRCTVTCILVAGFVWGYRITPAQMIRILEIILILNAFAIIATIIFPELKVYLEVINQYEKAYSRWRAIGLLNGEDAAGFFCNIGLIIETVKRIYNKQGPVTWKTILFVVATIFTSRMSMLFSVLILLVCLFIILRRKDFVHSFGIIVLLLPIVFFGGILWIITTNIAPGLRDPIYRAFPILNTLYSQLTEGYIDYAAFAGIIQRHTSIEGLDFSQILLGAGYRTTLEKDVGFLKTLYSIGVIGIISELFFYYVCCKKVVKGYNNNYYPQFIMVVFIIITVLHLPWEFKNSFLFSNGFFEMYIALFWSILFTCIKPKAIGKMCINR